MVMTRYQHKHAHSNHLNKIRNYGKYFGYPECCTKYFIKNILCIGPNASKEKKPPSRIQCRVSNRSGFIPCSYCSWRILSKQVKIEDLIHNRICDTPFPITNANTMANV